MLRSSASGHGFLNQKGSEKQYIVEQIFGNIQQFYPTSKISSKLRPYQSYYVW